jgi:hypothetical protein
MTLDNKGKLGLPWVYQINLQRHIGVYAKGALGKCNIAFLGAATNNLQATTVPTNSGAATYTGRRLLGSKEGQNLCRIF